MAKFLNRWHHKVPLDFSTPWVPGKYPISRDGFGYPPNKLTSTFWNINVMYLRIKNLRLSYSIPSKLLNKMGGISKLRIYLSATNVYAFKNTIVDPEHRLGGGALSAGGWQYPLLKTYNIGLNVTL
jgi:hypothetical protein